MTDNNENKPSNDELDAYLRGDHVVSKAYEDLEKVSSPQDLDARILARSRESVGNDLAGKDSWSYRPYAAAATVFLCLSVTFMFINEPGIPSPSDLQSGNEALRRTIPVTLQQGAQEAQVAQGAREELEEQGAQGAQGAQGVQAEQERQEQFSPLLQAEEIDSLDVSVDLGNAARLQAPAVTAEQLRPLADENANADVQELRDNAAQNRVPPDALSARTLPVAPAAFRGDRESWLQEIARQRQAGDLESAQQEEALFLESYPGTDIETALAELE